MFISNVALGFCNIALSYRGAMAGDKIKLDTEAIRDILVAETDSESGVEVSSVEDYFKEEEEEEEEEEAATSGG
jgi:hypothetical protein